MACRRYRKVRISLRCCVYVGIYVGTYKYTSSYAENNAEKSRIYVVVDYYLLVGIVAKREIKVVY